MPLSSLGAHQQAMRSAGGAELGRVIGASHLSWHFDPVLTAQLKAACVTRHVGALRLAWIRINAWAGERTREDIRANPERYLTFVMPLKGSMTLVGNSATIEIRPHELGVWDSTQQLGFEVHEADYEQLSVLVPHRMLRAPSRACTALHCTRIERSNILSELCIHHMVTLSKFLDQELNPYEMALSVVTSSLFDAVIASMHKSPRNPERLLMDVKDYIECYITDDSLSPVTIATAFELSTRYIHKLFESTGMTVGQWILNRRLERSAEELAAGNASVTEIAMKWGFKDLGHYSRSFKRHFGASPSDFRHRIDN